jgi:sterol desaturase/sphingolipid hydroxylase (fatty acid hydroxylase superfamily)
MSIILYAVPLFFLLIFIEILLEKSKGTNYYRTNDSINSLTAGVLSRMTGVVKQLFPLTVYVVVFEQLALFQITSSGWMWVAAFVLYDFCYYWKHRFGHEMNILWAAHVVHHSSEEYNLTTALRQFSSSFFSWIFYLPMAVLGFDPITLITVGSLNLIYQFWVHTQHIPKLGWYEWVFVTPSNHRVHHAQN